MERKADEPPHAGHKTFSLSNTNQSTTSSYAEHKRETHLTRNELHSTSKGLEEIVLDQNDTTANGSGAPFRETLSASITYAPTGGLTADGKIQLAQALTHIDSFSKITSLSTSRGRYETLPDDPETLKRLVVDLIYNWEQERYDNQTKYANHDALSSKVERAEAKLERSENQKDRLEDENRNLEYQLRNVKAQSQRSAQAQQATDLQQLFTFGRQQTELTQAKAACGKGAEDLQSKVGGLEAQVATLEDEKKKLMFNKNLAMNVAVKAVALASDQSHQSSGAIPKIPELPYHASITVLYEVRNAIEAAHDHLKQLVNQQPSSAVVKNSMEDMQVDVQQKELPKSAQSKAGKSKNSVKTHTKRSDEMGAQQNEAEQMSARSARARYWNDRHMDQK